MPAAPVKKFAYRVVESTYRKVKVGAILLYDRGRGPTHFESIVNTKTFRHVGAFVMKKIGPCWVVNGKVQFEKPPQPSGELTNRIVRGDPKRGPRKGA